MNFGDCTSKIKDCKHTKTIAITILMRHRGKCLDPTPMSIKQKIVVGVEISMALRHKNEISRKFRGDRPLDPRCFLRKYIYRLESSKTR
jgi:hypothetical protein